MTTAPAWCGMTYRRVGASPAFSSGEKGGFEYFVSLRSQIPESDSFWIVNLSCQHINTHPILLLLCGVNYINSQKGSCGV